MRPVVLEIRSLDVPHGFNLPDFGIRADVVPGMPAHVRVVPDKVGTFTVLNGAEGVTGVLAEVIQQAGVLSTMARRALTPSLEPLTTAPTNGREPALTTTVATADRARKAPQR